MRWLRFFLPSGALVGEPRTVVLLETVLAASKLTVPFLSLYLVQAHQLSYTVAGLFIAVSGIGGLIAVVLAGAAADRYGERPVLVALLAGATVSAAAVPHLPDTVALLVGFFLIGAFLRATQPPFSALVVRSAPVRQWTEIYAAEYWGINIGFAFTALVGGLIASHAFEWLFYLEAAGAALSLVMVVRLLPARPPGERPVRTVRGSRWSRGREALAAISLAARDRLALALISSSLLFALCLSQMTATLPLDMEQLGYSADRYGYVIFGNGLLLTLFQLAAGRLMARHRATRMLVLATAIFTLGFGLLAFLAGQLLLIVLCVSIWTVGEMLDAPVRNVVAGALARPGSRARYLGLVSAALTIGYCLGPLIGGWALQTAGREVLWLGTAGCALLATLIRWGLTSRVDRRIAGVVRQPDPRPSPG
ncbi:MAG: MFS transporter [Propionicimonas sp.]